MCQIGDIILIEHYKSHGSDLARHSFIVIDDVGGQVKGIDFDLACLVMSSFKSQNQKDFKMSFPANFPIVVDDVVIKNGNTKSGYIKADQLYYFDKSKIKYKVIGNMNEDIFNLLLDFIQELETNGIKFEQIIENL